MMTTPSRSAQRPARLYCRFLKTCRFAISRGAGLHFGEGGGSRWPRHRRRPGRTNPARCSARSGHATSRSVLQAPSGRVAPCAPRSAPAVHAPRACVAACQRARHRARAGRTQGGSRRAAAGPNTWRVVLLGVWRPRGVCCARIVCPSPLAWHVTLTSVFAFTLQVQVLSRKIMSSDSRKKLTAKRQNTNEFKQTFPQLANTKDDKLVALSPEMLQRVLTEVKKTNQNLFEEDPMKLDLDQLVKLATTVKKRGLDGELKVPLLLSSDDESKVSAHTLYPSRCTRSIPKTSTPFVWTTFTSQSAETARSSPSMIYSRVIQCTPAGRPSPSPLRSRADLLPLPCPPSSSLDHT